MSPWIQSRVKPDLLLDFSASMFSFCSGHCQLGFLPLASKGSPNTSQPKMWFPLILTSNQNETENWPLSCLYLHHYSSLSFPSYQTILYFLIFLFLLNPLKSNFYASSFY